jgi:hypothetical protein
MTVIRHFLSWEIIIFGQRVHKNQKANFKMNVITLYGTIKQRLVGMRMASYREMKKISA